MAAEHKIRIAKLTDRELVDNWTALAKEVGAQNVAYLIGNDPLFQNIPVEPDGSNPEYQELQKFLNVEGSELGARLNVSGHRIDYIRDVPFDYVNAILPDPNKKQPAATTKIFGALKQRFTRVDLNESLMELFDDDLKRYYTQREAELVKLQQLTEKLIKDNEAYRLKTDTEKDEYKESINAEYREKEEALDQRKQQLDKRQEEMDLSDAKSTRRKMRQAILDKLKPQGVMSLNRAAMIPIHVLLIVVSLLFLYLGFTVITADGFDPLVLTHAVKLGLASLGFVGTLMLYYRWMDSWLRKGVDENLRMRQLGIDVDRSTWLVEVLSELKSETGTSIPDDVLTALTRNLFTERGATAAVKHPTEDVLAALLGSSREVELDLPGGKVRIDGRGIRKVTKTVDAEGDASV